MVQLMPLHPETPSSLALSKSRHWFYHSGIGKEAVKWAKSVTVLDLNGVRKVPISRETVKMKTEQEAD